MNIHYHSWKPYCDVVAITAAVGSLLNWLPQLAAGASLVYTVFSTYYFLKGKWSKHARRRISDVPAANRPHRSR